MKLSLVVKAAGKMEGQVLPITLSQFVVGRDPQCHLRPASPMISKRHCALLQRDGKAYIRDFGSTNGTFLNDQPVKDEAELHDKDALKIGPLLFEVRLAQEAAPARGATPKPPTKAVAAKPGTMAATKNSKTPPPPPKAAAAAKKEDQSAAAKKEDQSAAAAASSADDDIAAMLLSLQDDDDRPAGVDSVVPEGSTVMDLIVPPPGAEDPNKPAGKDKDKPKPSGNTSTAAKSILEQYMKRPRG